MNLENFVNMFTGLKNKIKEETGNDVSLIPSIVTSNQPQLLGKGRHSRAGSTTSLGSFTIDGNREDTQQSHLDIKLADGKVITPKEFKKLEAKEEEWRKKLQKKEEELLLQLKKSEDFWKSKLESKENEQKKVIHQKDSERKKFEDEKKEMMGKIARLEESALKAADYQKKVYQYQEDFDQLEGFQTQEIAKIKHLLLGKEQELTEKEKIIKENNSQLENLRAEIFRLRKFEEDFEDSQDKLESIRHNFDQEKAVLVSDLAVSEENVRHLKDRVAVLEQRANSECVSLGGQLTIDEKVQALLDERKVLETRLEEAHLHLSDVKSSWSNKITQLETQLGRVSRQASEESSERRHAETERDVLNTRIADLEEEVEKWKMKCESKEGRMERLVKEKDELEEELKNVKEEKEADQYKLQHDLEAANSNISALEDKLNERDRELELMREISEALKIDLEKEKNRSAKLEEDFNASKECLETEKTYTRELNATLELERREKDDMMMRNAQVSQDVDVARQQLREQSLETTDLQSRVASLERRLTDKGKEVDRGNLERAALTSRIKELETFEKEKKDASTKEQELRAVIVGLEGEILEKTKSNKMLQQRVSDMRKTLQRELKVPATSIDSGGDQEGLIPPYAPSVSLGSSTMPTLDPTTSHHLPVRTLRARDFEEEGGDDVNFKYLKHVLIKFLTSREYEAKHLTRAVATLLRFSAEEERLLKETLEWKMSWFGTRPNLGNGQTAKTIPPS